MSNARKVLIVEDDAMIATDVEQALSAAGFEVCGVADSEAAALDLASRTHPNFAVVDVQLAPGDGRAVAREISRHQHVAVLMATAEHSSTLNGIGALALLPKPYDANLVPAALDAMAEERSPSELPDHMTRLS